MTFASEKPWSAISFQGRTVCYCAAGESIEARELGAAVPLEVTPELRAAIAAELQRQAVKAQEP